MATPGLADNNSFRFLADNDPDLSRAWSVCLDGYTEGTYQQRQELLDSVATLRNEFLRTFSLITDSIERNYVTALFYVYLKSQWTILNLRSGYLLARGQIDMRNMCRCGLLSALLDRVERTLTPTQVFLATNFLTNTLTMNAEADHTGNNPAAEVTPFRDSTDGVPEPSPELRARVQQLEAELAIARAREQVLVSEFGTSDPDTIVAEFRSARNDLGLLDELETTLGSIERSMRYVNA
ncbi:MAG: hypothetical protein SFU56_01975 [Capsulimonadales bacterium]|nr:hypothetical protein [Capsulimonadales bacterium]